MNATSGRARRDRQGAWIAVTGGLVAAMGAIVMTGWFMRVPWMVRFVPGTVPMVFSNALCMSLLGASLTLAAARTAWCRPVQTVIGFAVLLAGAVAGAQYAFDTSLALDLRALHDWLNNNPGRMAPNTAGAHVLAGATVLLAAHARPGLYSLPALFTAFVVTMLGVTGLAGYWLRPDLWYGWHVETRMALHTGAAFVAFGLGYAATIYRNQRLGELFRDREHLRVGLVGGGLMVFVGLVIGLIVFTLLQDQTGSVLRNGLQLSFQTRHDLIVSEVSAAVRANRTFTRRPDIGRALQRLQSIPEDNAARRFLDESVARHVDTASDDVQVYDTRDRLVARAGRSVAPQIRLALLTDEDASLLWDGATVHLRLSEPVIVSGTRIGRVEASYTLPGITGMVTDFSLLGHSAEMQLCVLDRDRIRCLPMRLDLQRMELPTVIGSSPTLIARALADERDTGFAYDYRGARVMASYGPVEAYGLGLVLKVDATDIFAPVRRRFEQVVPLIAVIIAFGILLLRAQVVPLVRRVARSESRFRGLLESLPDAIVLSDRQGRVLWVNPQAEQLLGYRSAELVGQPVDLLVPGRLRASHLALRENYMHHPAHRVFGQRSGLQVRRKDGSEFSAEISLSPQETDAGMQVIATLRDITERQRAVQALRDSEQRWQFALEGSRSGVWDWNFVTNRMFYSRQWKRMLGYDEHEIGDTHEEWESRVHPEDRERAHADVGRHLRGETPYYQSEHRLRAKDGSYRWILDRGMVVERDARGKPLRMIGTHTDISARKQAEEMVRELSLADELTGLRNRRGFMLLGEAQLNLARRVGQLAAIYFMDLDGLKRINDELGHAEGDQAISDFATALRETFREADLIARLGGDEFVVLSLEAPEADPQASAARLAEYLGEFNRQATRRYRLEASIGIAVRGPGSAESLTDLMARADKEMYEQKQRRRAGRGGGA